MNKEVETILIECHILTSKALKGYEDRTYISNKVYETRQYRNKFHLGFQQFINYPIINLIWVILAVGVVLMVTAEKNIAR